MRGCKSGVLMMVLTLHTPWTRAQTPLTQADRGLIDAGKASIQAAQKKSLSAEMQQAIAQATEQKAAAQDTADRSRTFATQLVQKLQQAQAIRLSSLKRVQAEKQARAQAPRLLIFASQALGQKSLDELLQTAAATPNTFVIFRGIPQGLSLSQGIWAIQALAAHHQPIPNILIDPTLFRRHHITTVPTIVMLQSPQRLLTDTTNTERVLGRVAGLSDPAWLIREVSRGAKGDQGIRGPVRPISEPDLIDRMKQRVAAIDWAAKKRQAIARFWTHQRFIPLKPATHTQKRDFDPRVTLTRDITRAEGFVIAKQGTVINPLDKRPFTQAVVVFDPLDPRQLVWLKQVIPSLKKRPGVQRLTFIATQFDREQGWKAYTQLTEALEAPVYLLTPDLVARFTLTVTPSVITAQNHRFVIEEIAPSAPLKQKAER
jgi:conjugal transfer pilus assembly protein TraW